MNDNWKDDDLDDLLKRSIGRETAEFDAGSWTKKNPDAAKAFKEASAGGVETNLNTRFWRTIMKSKIFKIMAPATVAAAIVIMVMILTIGGNPKIAFADAIKQLQGKSYEFVMEMQEDKQTLSYQCMVMEPGKMRMSGKNADGEMAVIVDGDASLVLMGKMKIAMRQDLKAHMDQAPDGFSILTLMNRSIADLWKLQTGSEKKLDRKKIDGVESEGFVVVQAPEEGITQEITVWADAKTAFPTRIEIVIQPEKEKGSPMTMALKGFKIIEKPDPSLFALKAPKGYRLAGYQSLKELEASKKLGKTTPEAQKILNAIELCATDKKDQAIETILSVDWKAPIEFSFENYLFTVSEDDILSLKEEDRNKDYGLNQLARLRTLAKEAQARAIKARDAKEYAQAEKLLGVIERLGDLCKGEKQLSLEMVGIAFRALAAKERVALYEAQNDPAKLEEAKKQVKQAEDENEAMKKRVKEMSF